MSAEESSPRPWRVVDSGYEDAGVDIFDAEGARVCRDLIAADAALVVDAVNQINNARGIARTAIGEYAELAAENNRLRKEVGRLRSAVKLLDAAAGPYCAPELRPRLLAEARAALGEGGRV